MQKITPEDYLDIVNVSDIQVTNAHVAWIQSHSDPIERGYTSHIKLLDRKYGTIKKFTGGHKKDYHPRFSPSGDKLAFISTRNGKPQIFVMDVDGGEGLPLTKSKRGVNSFTWSPDGKHIAFTSSVDPNNEMKDEDKPRTKFEAEQKKAEEEEEERKTYDPMVYTTLTYRRGTSYDHPDRYSHLFVIGVDKKEERRISDGYYHHSDPQFVSNTEVIALSNRGSPRDLNTEYSLLKFKIDDTSEGEEIDKVLLGFPGSPVAKYGHSFTPSMVEGNLAGQTTKWLHQRPDGSKEVFNKDLDRSVNMIRILDEDTILVAVDDHGLTDIRKYNLQSKEFEILVRGEPSVTSFDAVDLDEIYFTATHPLRVWAVWKWTKEGGISLVEDPNSEAFSEKNIVEPEEMWFTNPEGIKYHGWFFDAGQQDGEKPALVLSIHGGPHAMWNNAGTMWHEHQCYLSEGYSVLALNPIGSQGYGEEYSQIITAKWGVDDARDLLQAVDQISDRIDTHRLYTSGGSYAGFQVANLIARDHRFKAAVSQRGVYDLVTFGLNTDIPLFAQWEWQGTPWDKLEYLWEHSPVGRAQDIETPLMIIHSENDFRVAISQAEELFAALKLQDKEAVFVRYPRDGHELSRSGEPLHVIDRLEKMIDWFNSH